MGQGQEVHARKFIQASVQQVGKNTAIQVDCFSILLHISHNEEMLL